MPEIFARDAAHLGRDGVVQRFACDPAGIAALAASLRATGITIRETVDLISGTFCIERGHVVLRDHRDFEPMMRCLGLPVV